jgi:hypothetical protein
MVIAPSASGCRSNQSSQATGFRFNDPERERPTLLEL